MDTLDLPGGSTQVIRNYIGFTVWLFVTCLALSCIGCQSSLPARKPPSPLPQQEPLVIQDGYQIYSESGMVFIKKNNLPVKTIYLGESDLEVAYRLSSKPLGQPPLSDYQIDSAVVLSDQEQHYVVLLKPQVELLMKYPRPHHAEGPSIHIEKEANRLYFYTGGWLVKSYEVSTGKMPWYTPEGSFQIANKMPYPKGRDPEAPMGTRWMGLAVPYALDERGNKWDGGADPRSPLGTKFGIHGTNDESTIGTHASGGCIRMYNHNVNELYDLVDIGTPVRIVP